MAYLSTYRDFPFCIRVRTTQDIGSGTGYPVGLTHKEFFDLCYYGEFILEADIFQVFDDGDNIHTENNSGSLIWAPWRYINSTWNNGSAIESSDINNRIATFKEIGLSCNFLSLSSPGFSRISVYNQFSEKHHESTFQSFFETSRSLGFIDSAVNRSEVPYSWSNGGIVFRIQIQDTLFYNNKYYPYVSISAGPGPSGESGVSTYKYVSNYIIVDSVDFLGHSLDLYSPPNNGIASLSMSIQHFRRWPYDPGDTDPYPGKVGSGPVYDTVTGAQLRDPFAIVKRGDGSFYNPKHVP